MNSRAGLLASLLVIISAAQAKENGGVGLMTQLEDKLESKFCEYASTMTGWLEKFNDDHLGKSELGRFLHYKEIKPKALEVTQQSRNMKKIGLALIPLIFHVGATSTWMLMTTLLTAKSVAIGLALLVFKIAVSSAKLGSFFTLLKAKHHHEYVPHYEHHHGHGRSLTEEHHPTYLEHPPSHDDYSYKPDWAPADTASSYSSKSVATYPDNHPYEYLHEAKEKKHV